MPHALDCAAAIRAHLADLDRHTVADEIVRCCAHHRLKAYRLAKGWTVQRAVDELAQIAHRDELNARGADERTWRRWENGGVRPDEDYQDRLSRLFAANAVLLGFAPDYSGPTGEDDPTDRRQALRLAGLAIMAPALSPDSDLAEARAHLLTAEQTDLGTDTLDMLGAAIDTYSRTYARQPAVRLWSQVLADRRHVAALLQRTLTLKQRRELYVAAAWLSIILAWLADDMGQRSLALTYATDARRRATDAEHEETLSWAYDIEATIWLYADQPARALRAAEQGLLRAPLHSNARQRLVLQLGRAHAHCEHPDQSTLHFRTAIADQDQLPAIASGLFAADAARIHSYAATAVLALHQPDLGRHHARQAVELYQEGPALMAPTRRAVSMLDLAISCAQTGLVDEAADYGTRALNLPRPAAAVLSRGHDLDRVLRAHAGEAASTFHTQLLAASQTEDRR